MNASENKIPIAEFREAKFVPVVLRLKTDLNPATRQRERQPENITRRPAMLTFVVAGGGFAGVESIGALNDFVGETLEVPVPA